MEAQAAWGTVVVIDVVRAFNIAAFTLDAGAFRIYPVSSVSEAFQLRRQLTNALIMGEVDGLHPDGFDFGNSPAEICGESLKGKTLIKPTSADT